jgi:hypothetical protein
VIERRVSVSSDIVASSSVVNALACSIDYDIACIVFLIHELLVQVHCKMRMFFCITKDESESINI